MRKISRLSLVCAMILLIVVATPFSALAGERPSGKPFEAIWDELDDHQRQIDGFQGQIDDLQSQIDGLQSQLNDEIAARIAGDDNLQNQLDDIQEQINEMQEQVDDLQNQIDDLQAQIDAEEAARIAADIALQNNIDAETAARIAADILLQDQIDNHKHAGEDITSGTIDNARLDTGHGNGLDADTVDGMHISEFGTVWSASGSDIYYNDGNVGIGTSNPSGLIHGNGSAGGFMFWEHEIVDDTPITLIPDGPGDVERALIYQSAVVEIAGGTGLFKSGGSGPGSTTYLYSNSENRLILECASDGSVSIYRSMGSNTYEIVLMLMWI